MMTLEQLEAEVLALPKDAQVTLIARLLEHLNQTTDLDQNTAAIWIHEVEQRDQAMNGDRELGIPANVVFQRRSFLH